MLSSLTFAEQVSVVHATYIPFVVFYTYLVKLMPSEEVVYFCIFHLHIDLVFINFVL
jgi:hypothetical protein